MNTRSERFALKLLLYHGGGGSGIYAVGSTLFVGMTPDPIQVQRALDELRNPRKYAKFPELVTDKDIRAENALANRLERMMK